MRSSTRAACTRGSIGPCCGPFRGAEHEAHHLHEIEQEGESGATPLIAIGGLVIFLGSIFIVLLASLCSPTTSLEPSLTGSERHRFAELDGPDLDLRRPFPRRLEERVSGSLRNAARVLR